MKERLDFEIVCPNNHNQTVSFSQEELAEAQKAGGLEFHCNTCDTNWTPSHEDLAEMRKKLSRFSTQAT